MGPISGTKVAFVIPTENFRDEEYFQSKVLLQAKGAQVDTVSIGDPEEISGSQGGKARTDTPFATINAQDYDALVLVGGEGAKKYYTNKVILQLVRDFLDNNKIIGALGVAVGILAQGGMAKGKKVTGLEEEKANLLTLGVRWVNQEVVVDDTIITAKSAESALVFGDKLASLLEG